MFRGDRLLCLALFWALASLPLLAADELSREELDLIAQRSFHPTEVTLKKRVLFQRSSPQGGTTEFSLAPGKRVDVVMAHPGGLTVQALGVTSLLPYDDSDFLAIVRDRRDAAHEQRLKDANKMREKIAQPHVQATLFQLRAGGPGMTRSHVELALDAFPWSSDRLATRQAAEQFLAFVGLSGIVVQQDEDNLILVTSQNAQRQNLEVHWNNSLPRNQFFVRSPQALDPQLSKGFSYEIPREKPLLLSLTKQEPTVAKEIQSIIPEDGQPVPLPEPEPETTSPTGGNAELANELRRLKNKSGQALPPPSLPSSEWDDLLARFNLGELDSEETRQLFTRYEPFGDEVSRDELDDLIEWLQPENKHVREDEDGITATLYFKKPYVFITARPEQNAYEFIVYPAGFWESQPMRFLYQRSWFNLPEP